MKMVEKKKFVQKTSKSERKIYAIRGSDASWCEPRWEIHERIEDGLVNGRLSYGWIDLRVESTRLWWEENWKDEKVISFEGDRKNMGWDKNLGDAFKKQIWRQIRHSNGIFKQSVTKQGRGVPLL